MLTGIPGAKEWFAVLQAALQAALRHQTDSRVCPACCPCLPSTSTLLSFFVEDLVPFSKSTLKKPLMTLLTTSNQFSFSLISLTCNKRNGKYSWLLPQGRRSSLVVAMLLILEVKLSPEAFND
jgi:hypothetical protein